MKKKIVITVQMNSDRSRSKALKIAAGANCVQSVGLEGVEKDKVVITGEGVDCIKLTVSLRKKVGFAKIESVEDVKPPVAPTTTPDSNTKPADPVPASNVTKSDPPVQTPQCIPHTGYGEVFGYVVIDDEPPQSGQCCQM